MARKKEKFPYKYLRPEQLEEIREMKTSDLLKEHVKEGKNMRAIKKMQKEDSTLIDLDKQIKEHRQDALTDDLKKEIQTMKDRMKEIKAEIDEEILELLEDRKELKKGYRDQFKAHQERDEVILTVLEKRSDT